MSKLICETCGQYEHQGECDMPKQKEIKKKKTPRKLQVERMDKLFSRIIRLRALTRVGGCEYCLKPKTITRLQCSHFVGRTNYHTRWDLMNCSGLDGHCHMYLEHNPHEHEAWMVKHIGSEALEDLIIRSRSTGKVDLDKIEAFLKESLKRWEGLCVEDIR